MPGFLRNADQFTGLMILAGSGGGDIGILRQQYGCRPEAMIVVEASGPEWESSCVGQRSLCWRGTAIWLQADSAGAGRRDRAPCGGGVSGGQEQAVAFWRLDDGRAAFCGRAAALGTSRQGF
jgi:hypothetical protein